MKATLLIVIGCTLLTLSSYSLAACCAANCNPYETKCQCTDISCNTKYDGDCLSRSECCEAFGNVGAR